jgi:AP-4 complex subunit epsilon-1
MVIHRFYQISPSNFDNIDALMKTALCDKIPAVMGASLNFFLERAKSNPSAYKELASSFVVILKQIIDHKLPKEYDYKSMPAPWLQMKLLEILSYLGKDD